MTKYRVLFDNELTVAFSIFMSIWSVLFLEFWERRSATLAHRYYTVLLCTVLY